MNIIRFSEHSRNQVTIDLRDMRIYSYYDCGEKSIEDSFSTVSFYWAIVESRLNGPIINTITKKIVEYNETHEEKVSISNIFLWVEFDYALSCKINNNNYSSCFNVSLVLLDFDNPNRIIRLYNITSNSNENDRLYLYNQLDDLIKFLCSNVLYFGPIHVDLKLISMVILERSNYELNLAEAEVISDYDWVSIVVNRYQTSKIKRSDILHHNKTFCDAITWSHTRYNPDRLWKVLPTRMDGACNVLY